MEDKISDYYEQHGKLVFRYLYKLCQDRELAEELTQETFFQAIRTIGRYRGDCKPSVWLCQIARHVWYKYLEKNKNSKYHVGLDETIPDESRSALDQVIQQENKMELYGRMQKLKPEMREVLYLRILGELSYREIGIIMGKTENWARVTYYRGKEQLMKGECK